MATLSKSGPRFLIPSSFPASQQFVEMRRVGTFPHDAVFAVLYGYLEQALALRSPDMVRTLQRVLPPQACMFAQQILQGIGNQRATINLQELETVAQMFAQANRLETETPYYVPETSMTLCSQLGITASLYFAQFSISQSPLMEPYRFTCPGSVVELNICADEGKIYLLYKTLTKDSFVQVSCGHFLLKYDLLEFFKASAGGYPFGEKDCERLAINCMMCNAQVGGNDLLQVLPALAGYRQPTSVALGSGQCELCLSSSSTGINCTKCCRNICLFCAVTRATSGTGPNCQCGASFYTVLMRNQEVRGYQRLNMIIRIAAGGLSEAIPEQAVPPSQGPEQTQPREKQVLPQQHMPGNVGKSPSKPPVKQTSSRQRKKTSPLNESSADPCKLCDAPVGDSFSLCKSRCCCFKCELRSMFRGHVVNMKCPHCHKSMEENATRITPCRSCNQSTALCDLYYCCELCGIRMCLKCARVKHGATLLCSRTGVKHDISEKKEFLLIKKEEENCSVF